MVEEECVLAAGGILRDLKGGWNTEGASPAVSPGCPYPRARYLGDGQGRLELSRTTRSEADQEEEVRR